MAGVPLSLLLDDIASTDSGPASRRAPVIQLLRPPMEAAWIQMPSSSNLAGGCETYSRVCLARAGYTLAIIIFDFWPEDGLSLYDVWRTFLETLMVGEYNRSPHWETPEVGISGFKTPLPS